MPDGRQKEEIVTYGVYCRWIEGLTADITYTCSNIPGGELIHINTVNIVYLNNEIPTNAVSHYVQKTADMLKEIQKVPTKQEQQPLDKGFKKGIVYIILVAAALKVVSKKLNADGTYTIETARPEVYEVFDEIDINKTAIADPSQFIPAEGVSIVSASSSNNDVNSGVVYTDSNSIDNLGNLDNNIETTKKYTSSASNTISLTVELGSGGFSIDTSLANSLNGLEDKLTVNGYKDPNYEKVKSIIENTGVMPESDFFNTRIDAVDEYLNGDIELDSLKNKLDEAKDKYEKQKKEDPEEPFKKGWKITGSLDVEFGVEVEAKIDYGFIYAELEKFSLTTYDKITSKLEFEGKLEQSEKIGEIPIPIGAGFSVNVVLRIYMEENGTISLKYEVENNQCVEWNDGKYKKTKTFKDSNELELSASYTGGFKCGLSLSILNFDLAECGLDISTKAEIKTAVSRGMEYEISETEKTLSIRDIVNVKSNATKYCPLLSIYIGGEDTLLDWVGVDVSFDLISEDTAPKTDIWRYDESCIISERVIPIHEEETTTEEPTTPEVTTEDNTANNDNNNITLSAYALTMTAGTTEVISPSNLKGYEAGELIWDSSDKSVATVSSGKYMQLLQVVQQLQ